MAEPMLETSFDFSIRLMEMIHYLKAEGKDFPLMEQLLLCGNGIGINMRLAEVAAGRERVDRMRTAAANAAECRYLLSLMERTGYLTAQESRPIQKDCRLLQELITVALGGR